MTHQVPWNKVILEEFIRIGCLSETEEMIMRTRVHGLTITKQSYELNMSESNIKKILAEYFNVEEDKIVKTKDSYIVVQNKQTVQQEVDDKVEKK